MPRGSERYAYGRFVGERFKDLPNIVWMLGGDYAFPPSHRWLGDAARRGIARWRRRAADDRTRRPDVGGRDLRRPRLDGDGHRLQLLEGSSRPLHPRACGGPRGRSC